MHLLVVTLESICRIVILYDRNPDRLTVQVLSNSLPGELRPHVRLEGRDIHIELRFFDGTMEDMSISLTFTEHADIGEDSANEYTLEIMPRSQ